MKRHAFLVLGGLLAAGCSAEADPAGTIDALTFHRDVKPILDANCVECHQEGGIAPFALTTYEQASLYQGFLQKAVEERVMPPWLPGEGCNEYQNDRSLTQTEISVLSGWVDLGAPEGDPADARPVAAKSAPELSRVDVTIDMPVDYMPQEDPDDYRCFLVDWPAEATTYVSGFRANPGNEAIVHHVIAFLVQPDKADDFVALDEADAGPGYTCFGGAGGENDATTMWLGGWAPGGTGGDYAPGTGIRVLPGSKIALQVHYNLANASAVPDRTSVSFKVDEAVEHEAVILPWTNLDWFLFHQMPIPAGERDVVHSHAADPTMFSGGRPFTIHGVGLHMHTLGTEGNVSIVRANGARECLMDVPRWDFHWQNMFGLARPTPLAAGDQIAIECHWDNSAANQPLVDGEPRVPADVNWGEGTSDEMCLAVMYVSLP